MTRKTSLGFAVIDFAETLLEMKLFPWQKWLLIHMLELLPDNSMRFRTVLILVARQNGKSTLSQVLALWFMYVYHVALVLGTAQDLDVAEEIWQGAIDLIQEVDEFDQPVRPELHALLDRVVMVNGKKSMVLKTGERYKVKAANRRAGRGLSGDLILLDELREHQSWDAWGAITKTTMARAHALILALSNAGDATSVVLRYLRQMAHAAVGDPDGLNAEEAAGDLLPSEDDTDLEVEIEDEDTLAIFEWSAPPGCDIHDRDGWAMANPSMGYENGIAEKTIASAAKTDPEPVFRTEVLCQEVDTLKPAIFGIGKWEACGVEASAIAGTPSFGIAATYDHTFACIGSAGLRDDDLMHVEPVDHQRGTGWVVARARELQDRHGGSAVVDGKGPAAFLIPALEAVGVRVMVATTSDVLDSCALIDKQVKEKTLRHMNYPELDGAVAGAQKRPVGDRWALGRKTSTFDISPLEAVTLAAWGAVNAAPLSAVTIGFI